MSRFRPPSLSSPNHFLQGQTTAPDPDATPPPASFMASPNSDGTVPEVLYAGPPTPSFARRQSQLLASSPLSPEGRPASVSISKAPPKRAPPPRPSQVAADGNAPTPVQNAPAPSPLRTESMTMEELAAFTGAAMSPMATAVPVASPSIAPASVGDVIKCDILTAKKHSAIDTNAPTKASTAPLQATPVKGPPPLHSAQAQSATPNGYSQLVSPNSAASPSPSPAPSSSPSPHLNITTSPESPPPDIIYRGPATPSFARKQSILATKGTSGLLSPNALQSPTSSVSSTPTSVNIVEASPSPTPVAAVTSPTPIVAPAAVVSNELPPGWVEYQDATSGKSYYHHAASKVTVWERPAPAPAAAMVSPSPDPAAIAATLAAARQKELDDRIKREHEERVAAAAALAAAQEEEQRRLEAAAEAERQRVAQEAAAAAAAEAERLRVAAAAQEAAAAAERQRLAEERAAQAAAAEQARLAEETRAREAAAAAAAAEERRRMEEERIASVAAAAAAEVERVKAEAAAALAALEQARQASEAERVRLAQIAEQERLERERLAREAEELRLAQAEQARLKAETEALVAECARLEEDRARAELAREAERLRLERLAEEERVRLDLARETERLREEHAKLLADTERLKLEAAQAEIERVRQDQLRAEQEKQAMQARLEAMEKRMEQEAAERAEAIAQAQAQAAEQARVAEQARLAAAEQARLAEEQRHREQQEQERLRRQQEEQAAAEAHAAAVAEQERQRQEAAYHAAQAAAALAAQQAEAERQRIEAEQQQQAIAAAAARATEVEAQRQRDEAAAAEAAAAKLAADTAAAAAALAVAASPASLASEWVEYIDQASGRPYYYNKSTKVTVWTKPAVLETPVVHEPVDPMKIAPTSEAAPKSSSSSSVPDAPSAPPLTPNAGQSLRPKRGSVIIQSRNVMEELQSQPIEVAVPAVVKPVLKQNLKRGSVLLATGAEFRPPPPRRGSVSMIAPNFPNGTGTSNGTGPGPQRGSLMAGVKKNLTVGVANSANGANGVHDVPEAPAAPPLPSTLHTLAPKRGSVIIKSLASQVVLSEALSKESDDEEDATPKEPPPKPTPAAIAARRVSMSLGLVQNGVLATAAIGSTGVKPTASTNAGAQAPKPDEWREVKDGNGNSYWYNRKTRETSWVDPSKIVPPSSSDLTSSHRRLNPDWKEYFDQTGASYFHNRKTNVTVWGKPEDFELPLEEDEHQHQQQPKQPPPPASPKEEEELKQQTPQRRSSQPRVSISSKAAAPSLSREGSLEDNKSDSEWSTTTPTASRARPHSITSDLGADSDEDEGAELPSDEDDDVDGDEEDEDEDVAELAAMSMGGMGGMTGGISKPSSATDTSKREYHARTVSDASALTRPNLSLDMPSTPTSRPTSASMALSPSYSSTPKSQIRKCTLNECVSFSVRDGYCLRHQWRKDFDLGGASGRSKESMGQFVAAKEILTTEKSYLDQLRTIQKAFYLRLQTSITLNPTLKLAPLLSEDDLHRIFINHSELLSISEQFYADLTELQFHDRLVEFVATVLLHYIPQFTCYSTYLEGFDESRKRLTKLKETSSEFASFISITEKIEGLSLESFLVTPVQRLPRYLLLLKELSRRLTGTDPATVLILADCNQAHDDLAKMTTSLNSSLNTAENMSQLKNLSRLFLRTDSRFQSFVKPNRKLLKQGILRKKFSSKSYNLQSYKTYYFFLTNDLIFYAAGTSTKQQDNTAEALTGQSHVNMQVAMNNATSDTNTTPIYKMKHLYRLEDMYVDKHDPKITAKSAKKAPNPLKFYMWNEDGRVIGIQAANETEREQWFNAIDSAIAAIRKQAK